MFGVCKVFKDGYLLVLGDISLIMMEIIVGLRYGYGYVRKR